MGRARVGLACRGHRFRFGGFGLVELPATRRQRTDTTAAARLLKLLAIALLAICLLEPMRSGTRPRPQANVLPILVDNSQSMRLKTASQSQSRHDRVVALVQ